MSKYTPGSIGSPEEALAKIDALTVDNDRLRNELDKLEIVAKRIMRQDATFLTNERAENDRLRCKNARLVAACRALRVVNNGCVGWTGAPAVIAEFDAALAACEEG